MGEATVWQDVRMSLKQNLEDKNASQVWLQTPGETMMKLYLDFNATSRSYLRNPPLFCSTRKAHIQLSFLFNILLPFILSNELSFIEYGDFCLVVWPQK